MAHLSVVCEMWSSSYEKKRKKTYEKRRMKKTFC
jgi:hypothetical protein